VAQNEVVLSITTQSVLAD